MPIFFKQGFDPPTPFELCMLRKTAERLVEIGNCQQNGHVQRYLTTQVARVTGGLKKTNSRRSLGDKINARRYARSFIY